MSLGALAALSGAPVAQTGAAVATLVDAHLLESPEPGSFAAHDLLRIYAAERAQTDETADSRDEAMRRLLAWYLRTANVCVQLTRGQRDPATELPLPESVPEPQIPSAAEASQWLRSERENLLKLVQLAADQRLDELCWRLAMSARFPFEWAGQWTDQIKLTTIGLAAAERDGTPEGMARHRNGLGGAHLFLGRAQLAIECFEHAVRLYAEIGDRQRQASTLINIGLANCRLGDPGAGIKVLLEALAIHRDQGHLPGEAMCLHNLGLACQYGGDYDTGLGYLEQALAIRSSCDVELNELAATMHSIGALLLRMDRPAEAIDRLRPSLELCQAHNLTYGEGMTLLSLGEAHHMLGEIVKTRSYWRRAHELLAGLGVPEVEQAKNLLNTVG